MNIFEPISKSFLENKKIEISFSRAINKKEKDFLKFLFKKYNLSALLEKNLIISNIPVNDVMKELKYRDFFRLKKFLDNLQSKKIEFSIYNSKNLIISGNFPIFSSYSIVYDKLNFIFSKEISLGKKADTLFFLLKVDYLIFMGDEHSYNLYTYLVFSGTEKNTVEVSLNELKEILNTGDRYERFFDFETKVLKKIVDDINLFSEMKLRYKKIKIGEFKNNRVEKILFILDENKNAKSKDIQKNIELNANINKIIDTIRDDIKDFHTTYELIKNYINKRGIEYVQKNVVFTKRNFKINIEQNLKKSLLLDLAGYTSVKRETVLANIKKIYSTPFLIHLEIASIFKKNKLDTEFQELLDSGFFNKLNVLKNGNILEKKFENFSLHVHYFTLTESTIRIKIIEK